MKVPTHASLFTGLLMMTLIGTPLDAAADADEGPFALSQYRWKHRVLVVSAPTKDDENLQAQLEALASAAAEFSDRDMVLVTLIDDGTSTAGRRELSNTDVTKAREALRIRPGAFALRLIGKDGGVKLSSDTATPVSEIYALIDRMPMRRREMSERD